MEKSQGVKKISPDQYGKMRNIPILINAPWLNEIK